jgi:type I restriction-modification system DNA methylase subunit
MKILSVKILGEWENLEKSIKGENFQNGWKKFCKNLSSKYPSIFYEGDKFFNCRDDTTLETIKEETRDFKCDEDMKDSFATSYGDIYEYFMSSYGKKSSSGSKELGQFFTPRKLIHLIFHGLNLSQFIQDKDNFSIYDPCMGTGGFLTRLYKLGNIKPENIYGCETEIDTIKFGVLSVYLTTGIISEGIKKCNSLSENPFISNKKFSGIVTNPPFGTSMKYTDLKEKYEFTFKNSTVSFEEVYPIKTNNGACLFIQHCVYMLEENGFCAIVLPDGELFEGNSKWSKEFRQWLSEQVNIRTILKVPSGTFEHAGVKTNVVIFTKDGPTQNINFIETTKECDEVKDMFTISFEELKITGYSFDVGEYLVEETDNYDVPVVSLSQICNFITGEKINSKEGKKEGKYPLYYCSILGNLWYDSYTYDGKGLIVNTTNGSGKSMIYFANGKYNIGNSVFHFGVTDETNTKIEYVYLFLKLNIHILENEYTGTLQKSITKERLGNIKIPLPSLEIQQQIVDELSQIETSIETIELRISQMKFEKDQYKKYGRKAEIRELLKDSEEKMLGELITCNRGNLGKPNDDASKNIYPYYSGKTISGYLDNYVFEGPKIMINYRVNTKTDIFNICKYIEGGQYNCSRFSWVLTLNSEMIDLKYLYHYLENLVNYTPIIKGSIPEINSTNLKEKIKIKIPSQEIQKQCIKLFEEKEKFIQSIDEKIDIEKEYITHLKNLAKDVISSYC